MHEPPLTDRQHRLLALYRTGKHLHLLADDLRSLGGDPEQAAARELSMWAYELEGEVTYVGGPEATAQIEAWRAGEGPLPA